VGNGENATPVPSISFSNICFHAGGYWNLNPSDGSSYVNDWFSAKTNEKLEEIGKPNNANEALKINKFISSLLIWENVPI
jgi:hypothetical protein